MKMQYFGTACPFVKIVNVLCNDLYIEIFLEPGETDMSGVRLT